jgi:hypothetical protein
MLSCFYDSTSMYCFYKQKLKPVLTLHLTTKSVVFSLFGDKDSFKNQKLTCSKYTVHTLESSQWKPLVLLMYDFKKKVKYQKLWTLSPISAPEYRHHNAVWVKNPCSKYFESEVVAVMYCCIIDHPKLSGLKQEHFIAPDSFLGQKIR